MCFSDFPLLFVIFVAMLEKNEIIQSALHNLKIEELNPMQEASLEQATGRKDVILLSPTGSGKTLAYLLPLLLTLKPDNDNVQVLILVPSRELALQIDSVFKAMGTAWKTCCCYGGHPIAEEKKSISGNHPAIIIGTPGRITDHLSKGNFNPETIETLIIDEFDKSLEFGFHDEMAEIITQLPGLKKRMLLSATDAEEIPEFTGLNRTVRLNFLPDAADEQESRLKLMKVFSPAKDKVDTLYNLLCTLGSSSSIVFCNHRDGDLLCFSFADTLHFRQALRLFFYDPERVIAEFFHNTSRQCLSHSADRTGSQISFHSYTIRGGHRLVVLYFKLSSIHRMLYILPFGSDIFSLSQTFAHADTGHFFPFHHQYHDGISIFTVLKDNMIYISCNAFHFYSSFCCVFVAVLCEMPGKCRGCGKR